MLLYNGLLLLHHGLLLLHHGLLLYNGRDNSSGSGAWGAWIAPELAASGCRRYGLRIEELHAVGWRSVAAAIGHKHVDATVAH